MEQRRGGQGDVVLAGVHDGVCKGNVYELCLGTTAATTTAQRRDVQVRAHVGEDDDDNDNGDKARTITKEEYSRLHVGLNHIGDPSLAKTLDVPHRYVEETSRRPGSVSGVHQREDQGSSISRLPTTPLPPKERSYTLTSSYQDEEKTSNASCLLSNEQSR